MALGRLSRWPVLVLIYMSLVHISAFSQLGVTGTAEGRSCEELRREMSSLLQRAFEYKAGPKLLKKLIPKWTELSLPANCSKQGNAMIDFKDTPTQKNGGSKKIQTESRPVIAVNFNGSAQRNTEYGGFVMGVSRPERAVSRDQVDTALHERRSNNGNVLERKKRFLNTGLGVGVPDFSAMSLGRSVSGGPAGEVSDSAQMMNNLLMYSKLQKRMLDQEYGMIGRRSSKYVGDRVSFGSGMYGDVYTGRRKREVSREVRPRANSRNKRFLFLGDPAEGVGAGLPSLFGSLFGVGPEPSKKSEFSGDVMKRTMGNTLLAFLPPGMQPPSGKDPLDFVKNMAPLFLLSSSPGSVKRQNRNGLFGDNLPGKKRRKRSSNFIDDSVELDLSESKGLWRF